MRSIMSLDCGWYSGIVLSTDAKPRLKWTADLHQKFVMAVNQLGGAHKATPKTVMKIMGIPGLTLYHLKSHLQKYRLSRNIHGPSNICNSNKIGSSVSARETFTETKSNEKINEFHTTKNMGIGETLQLQMEVQRTLHEQLEVQRHLQMRIEAQGEYLQAMLEKAQEAMGLKNTACPLSEHVWMGLHQARVNEYSTESSLTSCEKAQKHHDTRKTGRTMADRGFAEEWRNGSDGAKRSISGKVGEGNESGKVGEGNESGRCFNVMTLDLNSRSDVDTAASHYKQLDLNGMSCN